MSPHLRLVLVLILAVLAGCGGDDQDKPKDKSSEGYNPVILGEQVTREFSRDLERKGLTVSQCVIAKDNSYTCVGESDLDTQITGSITENGQFDARAIADGSSWAGKYPEDTAYRGLDLAELGKQVQAKAVAEKLITPTDEPPECSVDYKADRAFECTLDSKDDPEGASIFALRVDLVVAENGGYTADSSDGPIKFKGTLTKDVMTDSASVVSD